MDATLTALPVCRVLPEAEYHRLLSHEPFASGGLPNPAYNRIIVAEVGTEIVACWMVLTCVHVEPLWIHPEHRKRPGLIRRLWTAVAGVLQESHVLVAFGCITDADAAQNVPLALRLGFEKVAGDLYYIRVPPAAGEES
jgi:hypothetical protein